MRSTIERSTIEQLRARDAKRLREYLEGKFDEHPQGSAEKRWVVMYEFGRRPRDEAYEAVFPEGFH